MLKNLLKIFIASFVSVNSFADTSHSSYLSSYNSTTGTVEIPAVTVNGIITYRDVQLHLRSDGLFEVTKALTSTDSFIVESTYIQSGDIVFNNIGEMIHITGTPTYFDRGSSYYNNEMTELNFQLASSGLPEPEKGSKGTHYIYDVDGKIAYSTPLGIVLDENNVTYKVKVDVRINEDGSSSGSIDYKTVGDLIIDQNNNIFTISGVTGSTSISEYRQTNVYKTQDILPDPAVGSKGTYYIMDSNGDMAYLNVK